MMKRSVASRYAKVLFEIDRNNSDLEERLKNFEAKIKVLKDHPKLLKFLRSPQVSFDDKKKVLQDSLKETFDSTFMHFLFYLIQKGKLADLNQIADEYRLMVNKVLEIWEADIVTAVPMDEDNEIKLKEKLEKLFHKRIKINKLINPQIIGGAILIVANEMLDWSVAGRLKKLKETLIRTHV